MPFIEDTIGTVLEKVVANDPDREFMVYPDRDLRFTYKEFDERVNTFAKGLLAIGIGKGDHVGIWAKNVPDWLTFMFAAAKIGAVLVTVNTAYKSHEVEYVIKQSDMKAIAIIDGFRDVNYIDIMYELVPELKTQQRGKLHSDRFPFLKSVIFIGQEKHRGMYNSAEILLLGKHGDEDSFQRIKQSLDCNDVVNMQYTSGTTGFPKGVMLTHRNILNNGLSIGDRQKFTSDDRVCLPVPLFHCFGIVLGVMAVLTHGATHVMLELYDPLMVLAAVQKEKCTALYGVPTMFIAEYTHPMFKMFDLSSLRTGIMAGSTCPIDSMKKVINEMNCKEITIVYGLTESSPGITQTTTDDPIELRVSTVGTVFPHVEAAVLDPETHEPLPPNTIGEICCRGYNVMKGYYKMTEETKKAIDEKGWLHSGDLGTCDENGYYRITGRIKDMIIRGGENIYPREIEEFLYTVNGVKDAQVVGIPDKKYGEIAGAFVMLNDGIQLAEEDIQDYARTKIARYKVPKHIFFVKEYPLTASGKVQKFKLRELAIQLLENKKREEA
ncbi:acyl-CoA synthetase (AMP-forming)/AMP-acid ligase II [Methanomethylovorans hollandica DSM 15978]|uniref:Acyl-CoA synthetase (AMP-forming)/AMP-acid ligase II n=1 Tax=Methanomethylovorans hollandica (strain DSM 15978 / NBRC 107637 / DMS1) TaxID=867904 RepID=L0L1C8_METHD|nr:AMP-binding protein [Methanomethylovorans hollandica]AGB50079.1 acyl-CoA synthetase (AMP-forming)/AMP-acid ligase II [Methanomethylovorans hollandica DSM 15978]